MTEPIVRTEPLGAAPLARLAIDGQRGDWYPGIPRSEQAWKTRAEAVRASSVREWLEAIQPALSASGAAAARVARVAAGRGIVVTTGQQPGLFGGPIYTWSKALSALALADEIEASTGIPAAPVFWAANDDADFAEASWTAVAVAGGAERLTVAAGAPLGRTMADMPLGDVAPAFAALLRACGATVDGRPIDVVRAAYRVGATVGGAYLSLLRELFEPFGIAVLDAAHASIADASRPFLLRALDRANDVADALRQRDEAIRAAGFPPQVAEVAGLSLVFERPRDGGDKRRIPLTEAAAVAAQGDSTRRGLLSPNVLLRPVIERAILPTVAYVAGPGELSYFAQVSAVAPTLGLESPLAVPRWSTTILEPHVVRILSSLGLEEAELAETHRAEGRLARKAMSPALTAALGELRQEVGRHSGVVSSALQESDLPLPTRVIDGAQRAIDHRLDRLERRIVAAAKRRETETMTQIATARGALFPLGTRQERALNMLPFMARHGSVITDRMITGARAHARSLVGRDRETNPSAAAQSTRRAPGGESDVSAPRVESARAADA
jgi:bacillithiol biosynthesis cysteine-adding enzyme BshC